MSDLCYRCGMPFTDGVTITSTPTTHVSPGVCIGLMRAKLDRIRHVADEQRFICRDRNVSEQYLRHAILRLHAAIDSDGGS